MIGYQRQGSATQYLQDSVSTASPGQLLVMLYDRLALDLAQAYDAMARADRSSAHERLLHAQDIVNELSGSLDHTAGWSGSLGLASLYGWLRTELIRVNITSDLAGLRDCQAVVEPLRDSWRKALAETAAASTDQRLVG